VLMRPRALAHTGNWILKSTGGVHSYRPPWYGLLVGKVPEGQAVTATASEQASERRAGGPCRRGT
jgi:hypothetical protein